MRQHSEKYTNHVRRQSQLWRFCRWLCMAPLLGRDCVCPILQAKDVHHLHYRNLGHELPIRDVVPLHRVTHRLVEGIFEKLFGRLAVNQFLRCCYVFWLSVVVLGALCCLLKVRELYQVRQQEIHNELAGD